MTMFRLFFSRKDTDVISLIYLASSNDMSIQNNKNIYSILRKRLRKRYNYTTSITCLCRLKKSDVKAMKAAVKAECKEYRKAYYEDVWKIKKAMKQGRNVYFRA